MKTNLIFIDGSFPGGGAQSAMIRYSQVFSKLEEIETFYFPVGSLSASSHLTPDDILFPRSKGKIRRFFRLVDLIRCSPKSVLFVTSIGSFIAVLPIYLLFQYKVKLLYRYIQLPSLQIKAGLVPKYRWRLLAILRHLPDLYIAQTKEMKEEMTNLLDINPCKTIVIGNWISDPKLYERYLTLNRSTPESIVTFGVFGRIVKEKGLVDVVNALKICVDNDHDFKLQIFGEDIGGYKKTLIHEIDRLNLTHRVEFFPYQKDILGAMSKCDVIVNASYAEGYPNVLLEALALGKKVIFSRSVRVVDELLNKAGVGRSFDVGDCQRLAAHMETWREITERRYLVSIHDYDFDVLLETVINA
jgi:glycosyltransferase involved in cell wall biosynthesis